MLISSYEFMWLVEGGVLDFIVWENICIYVIILFICFVKLYFLFKCLDYEKFSIIGKWIGIIGV